jgi:hypothetical protein
MVISCLNELPAFLPSFTKEAFQPLNAKMGGVMDKTLPHLVTLYNRFSSLLRRLRQFMDGDLIFPLSHIFFNPFRIPEVNLKD